MLMSELSICGQVRCFSRAVVNGRRCHWRQRNLGHQIKTRQYLGPGVRIYSRAKDPKSHNFRSLLCINTYSWPRTRPRSLDSTKRRVKVGPPFYKISSTAPLSVHGRLHRRHSILALCPNKRPHPTRLYHVLKDRRGHGLTMAGKTFRVVIISQDMPQFQKLWYWRV